MKKNQYLISLVNRRITVTVFYHAANLHKNFFPNIWTTPSSNMGPRDAIIKKIVMVTEADFETFLFL